VYDGDPYAAACGARVVRADPYAARLGPAQPRQQGDPRYGYAGGGASPALTSAPHVHPSAAGGLYVHAWEFRPGTAGEGRQSKAAIEASKTWLDSHFVPFLTRELEDRQFLLGEWFTAADIVMGWEIMLLGQVGFFQEYPVLQAYHDRLAAQSSWKRTYPREIHTLCIWPHTDGRCKELHQGLNEVPLNVEL